VFLLTFPFEALRGFLLRQLPLRKRRHTRERREGGLVRRAASSRARDRFAQARSRIERVG